MKTITFAIAFTLTGLMAYSQRISNVSTTSITPNFNVGSTTTSTYSNSNSNYSNSSNNNSSNYNGNNGYNNNSYYNNNGYNSNNNNYNNGYNNNNYYNNTNNSTYGQNSYHSTDNSYGTQLLTEDKGKPILEKSIYNIPDQFNNYRKNTAIERFFSNNQKTSQTFIINAQTQNTLKGTGGTIVKIAPNSFVNKNGEVVTGNVDFELKEVYQKSDMIFSNAHTVANDVPLISGGEMFMGATKNGEVLTLANDKPILIEVPAATGSTESMQLFNGKPDRNTVNWNLAGPNSVTPVLNTNSSTGQSYNFSSNSMNWLNCDKFNRSTKPSTKVTVRMPQQYDSTNTAIFIVFSGQNTVTKFDNYNKLDRSMQSAFDTKWYSVPTGSDVTIVAISEINGQYYSSMQRTILVKDHQADLVLAPTTLDQFTKDMEKLP